MAHHCPTWQAPCAACLLGADMAESGQGGAQEKTEEPTAKRLRDARKQGDVWQSHDFTTTVAIIVFSLLAIAGAKPALVWMAQGLGEMVMASTQKDTNMVQRLRAAMLDLGLWTVIAAAISVIVSVVASAIQVGGVMSFERLSPDMNRLNPIEGLKRIFAWRTVVELIRLLIKLLALCVVLWILARSQLPLLAQAQQVPLAGWLLAGGKQFEAMLLLCCVVFGVVSLFDLFYQRWDYMRRKRMSKEEVKREHKDREGDPMLRGLRKQLHQEINFNNMLHQVRKASVVVVNPTHVAVALHYDPDETPIPMVVAKGEGEVARAIREAAEEAGVPIYRDVSLARTLNSGTPINDYIPDDLIEAVAQVLLWVERMKKQEEGPRPSDK
jgi:type III secretion protein U